MDGVYLVGPDGKTPIATPQQTLATTDLATHHAMAGRAFGVAFSHRIGATGSSSLLFANPAGSGKEAVFHFMDLFIGSETTANIQFRCWHNPTTNLPTAAVNSVVKNVLWTAANGNNASTAVVTDRPDGDALSGGTNFKNIWISSVFRRTVRGFPSVVLMPGASLGIYAAASLDQVVAYNIQWWEQPQT